MRSRKRQIDRLEDELAGLRKLATRNKRAKKSLPISTVRDANPDDMVFPLREWVEIEAFPGMRGMLTHTDRDTGSSYILCETVTEVDCGPHRHPDHIEEVVMMEGMMEDKGSGQRIFPGIRYKVPSGEVHWPCFPGPALFMVIFRKVG